MEEQLKEMLLYIKEHAEECEDNSWDILYNYMFDYQFDDYHNFDANELYRCLVSCFPEDFPDLKEEYGDSIDPNKFHKQYPEATECPEDIYDFFKWWECEYDHPDDDYWWWEEAVEAVKIMENTPSVDGMLLIYWLDPSTLDNIYSYGEPMAKDFKNMRKELEKVLNHTVEE